MASLHHLEVPLGILVGAVVLLHERDDSLVVRVLRGVWGVSKHIIESEYKSVSAIHYKPLGNVYYYRTICGPAVCGLFGG